MNNQEHDDGDDVKPPGGADDEDDDDEEEEDEDEFDSGDEEILTKSGELPEVSCFWLDDKMILIDWLIMEPLTCWEENIGFDI